jgi:serine/threonine protein kinase
MSYDGWEIIADLGAGGQGKVFKVRSPEAAQRRAETVNSVWAIVRKKGVPAMVPPEERQNSDTIEAWCRKAFPDLLQSLLAREDPNTLGALKHFVIPTEGPERERAVGRLEREVDALRSVNHPAILRLRHENLKDHFMVTEYHPLGPLSNHLDRFSGDVARALEALIPVVEGLALLHHGGWVHRDVKPANIFLAQDGRLVLGDFGIVFWRDATTERLTDTDERVGSRDWMAPWTHTGQRLEDVGPTFDVFAVGKVLWSMVSGKKLLPYWYHRRPGYDVEQQFPGNPHMAAVNAILDACVVEHERDCHENAEILRGVLHESLRMVREGGVLLRDGESYPCRVCARGKCSVLVGTDGRPERRLSGPPAQGRYTADQLHELGLTVRLYRCNFCHHVDIFHFEQGNRPPGWAPRPSTSSS